MYVRHGDTWPIGGVTQVRWRHNATVVHAWRGGDLRTLQSIPSSLVDLVRSSSATALVELMYASDSRTNLSGMDQQ